MAEDRTNLETDLQFLRDPEKRTPNTAEILGKLRSYCDSVFNPSDEVVKTKNETGDPGYLRIMQFERFGGCVIPFGSCLRGTAGEHSSDLDLYLVFDTSEDSGTEFPSNFERVFRQSSTDRKEDGISSYIFPENPSYANVDTYCIDIETVDDAFRYVGSLGRLDDTLAHAIVATLFIPDEYVYIPTRNDRLLKHRQKLIETLGGYWDEKSHTYDEKVKGTLDNAFNYLFEGTRKKHPEVYEKLVKNYFLTRFTGDETRAAAAVEKFKVLRQTTPRQFPSPEELKRYLLKDAKKQN